MRVQPFILRRDQHDPALSVVGTQVTVVLDNLAAGETPEWISGQDVDSIHSTGIFLIMLRSISPISAYILQQVTMGYGYCAHIRKVSRTHWRCSDLRCEFLKMNLLKGGCGSLNLSGFAFMNSDDSAR